MLHDVHRALVSAFVGLCESTGLRWGPNPRDLFFYRSPEMHLVEWVVFHAFVYVLYRMNRGYYSRITSSATKESMPRSWFNVTIGALYLLCWIFQVVLKASRPNPLVQLCWLFMPCHLITLVLVYVFLWSSPSRGNFRRCVYLASLATAFHWGPVSAAVFPDWSDHQFPMEGQMFFLHHGLLVLTPFYFAARYGLVPFDLPFLTHATWVATLINVGPYTLISYLSGLNVNYHLYPPPKLMKLAIFATQWYRFYVIAVLIVATVAFFKAAELVAFVLRSARLVRHVSPVLLSAKVKAG